MTTSDQDLKPRWEEGVSNLRAAAEHTLTASNLLWGASIALGTAATAYLWDAKRRDELFRMMPKMAQDPLGWWRGAAASKPARSE